MARSSSISSKIFSGTTAADLAALRSKLDKAQSDLESLKTNGIGVSATALADAVKPVSQLVEELKANAEAAQLELDKLKKDSGTVATDILSLKDTAGTVANDITSLKSRKEVTEKIETTVIIDGKSLPIASGGTPRDSGFKNNGTGEVAGASSWNAYEAVGFDVNQTGTDADTFYLVAGVHSNTAFYQISMRANGITATYSKSAGLVANGLPVTEWGDGVTSGIIYKSNNTLSVSVTYVGWNGLQGYYGPIVKQEKLLGFQVGDTLLADSAMLSMANKDKVVVLDSWPTDDQLRSDSLPSFLFTGIDNGGPGLYGNANMGRDPSLPIIHPIKM